MKKLVASIVLLCITFSFCFSAPSKDEFKTTYDEVEDITFITHKDMQKGAFYNLKDSATGERENISLYISDKSLTIWADYQNNDWMFIDGIVFLDADSNRLKIDYGKRTESDVKKRYCQMLWIEVWIGIGLSDFLQHTIFKFHVLGHKVKLFKAFQSSPTFFCLPTEFKSHGFCGLCRSVALC